VFGHNPTHPCCLIMSPWCSDRQLWMPIFLVPRPVLLSERKIFSLQNRNPVAVILCLSKTYLSLFYSVFELQIHLLKWMKLKYTLTCYIKLLHTAVLKEKQSCPCPYPLPKPVLHRVRSTTSSFSLYFLTVSLQFIQQLLTSSSSSCRPFYLSWKHMREGEPLYPREIPMYSELPIITVTIPFQ
jgi:hypothetical protein